jgi:hypothetical protein
MSAATARADFGGANQPRPGRKEPSGGYCRLRLSFGLPINCVCRSLLVPGRHWPKPAGLPDALSKLGPRAHHHHNQIVYRWAWDIDSCGISSKFSSAKVLSFLTFSRRVHNMNHHTDPRSNCVESVRYLPVNNRRRPLMKFRTIALVLGATLLASALSVAKDSPESKISRCRAVMRILHLGINRQRCGSAKCHHNCHRRIVEC